MTKNERFVFDKIISRVCNEFCSCGGGDPENGCEACKIYHLVTDGIVESHMTVEGDSK